MSEAIWGVWCEVWGGVTGSRATWLKVKGVIWTGDETDARQRAEKLNIIANNEHARAHFRYTAQRFDV